MRKGQVPKSVYGKTPDWQSGIISHLLSQKCGELSEISVYLHFCFTQTIFWDSCYAAIFFDYTEEHNEKHSI